MEHYDYIIVGAGSAGCALAHELSSDTTSRVLLLEAGGSDRSLSIKVPSLIANIPSSCHWGYNSAPDPSRAGKTEKWQRGRVLGGSSSINGMIFVRGAPQDYDEWAVLVGEDWAYSNVLPIFQELENSDQANPSRGHAGPLSVRTVRHPHRLTKAFVDSTVAAGFQFNNDYNDSDQQGVGYTQLSQRHGLRWSAADAFIRPIRSRQNFTLDLHSMVVRVLFDGTKAVGVEALRNGQPVVYGARRVILCGGAINTPQLLMLSGVGGPEELAQHNIPVVVASPEVGKNLREHPLVRMIYRTTIPSNNLTHGITQKLAIAGQFAAYREGAISSVIEALAFLKSNPSLARPDLQLHFTTVGLKAFYNDSDSPLLPHPSVTVYVNLNHPKSSGCVRLESADPLSSPKIECRLLSDKEDIRALVQGVRLVRRIMSTTPICELVLAEDKPSSSVVSDKDLEAYVVRETEPAYHPVGTCRMGSDKNAVVTSDLRVRGTQNLWIADGSVLPNLISGNTNAVCMMIGKKLGKLLRAEPQVTSPRKDEHVYST